MQCEMRLLKVSALEPVPAVSDTLRSAFYKPLLFQIKIHIIIQTDILGNVLVVTGLIIPLYRTRYIFKH